MQQAGGSCAAWSFNEARLCTPGIGMTLGMPARLTQLRFNEARLCTPGIGPQEDSQTLAPLVLQ